MGTMHGNLPQGLDDRYSFQELNTGTFQIKFCNEEHLPVITFFLGILAALYHRCNYVSQDVKEKENSESLNISLAEVKVDCHEYLILKDLINKM
jgi:hypothetical protein